MIFYYIFPYITVPIIFPICMSVKAISYIRDLSGYLYIPELIMIGIVVYRLAILSSGTEYSCLQ